MVSCASVKLVAPHSGEEISLYRADYRSCIAQRKDKKYGEIENIAFPEPVRFKWECRDGACTGGVLEISRRADFAELDRSIPADGVNSLEVYNLQTGTEYFWRIRGDRCRSAAGVFRTGGEVPRIIRMTPPHPVNIRDIGGKMVPGVGRVRQGLVFRGSEINEVASGRSISGENLATMREVLKIRTDLDLRYPVQVEGMKASPLGTDVNYIHVPVNAYNSFTPEQNQLFSRALRVFADSSNYPVYVHCAGGADRTGEIVFLLEQLLGVPREEALIEYETTSLSIYPRPRTIDYFQKWLAGIAEIGGAENPPEQQVVNYLKSIGITDAEIQSIRNILIEK
ncbi:MAG: tyrosine-protein phosphatase [Victivallales bacterium]|nr:tyrosine-protein phosphatase [Victivallales bacterium]